jgi:RNA polymerase sigma-70 factor (ECF subfamily)
MPGDVEPGPGQLLQQARAGNAEALGQLLQTYRRYLAFLAGLEIGRRLQGKVDPSDVVQEAFLGAHRDFAGFRGTTEKEFTAWLRQVLASVLANLVRHYQGTQRRDVRLERQLVLDLEESAQALDRALIDAGASPSQQAASREQAVLLANALARLPDEQRQLLVLRHLEGLTFAEVARRLGRSPDSVKKQWPRALAALRRALGGERP